MILFIKNNFSLYNILIVWDRFNEYNHFLLPEPNAKILYDFDNGILYLDVEDLNLSHNIRKIIVFVIVMISILTINELGNLITNSNTDYNKIIYNVELWIFER